MTIPVQTAGTSSSRHFRRAAGGDPRPDLVGDFRDDQDLRMGHALPAHACRQSQAVPSADDHASVTVPRARRFRTESNNRGKRPSMTYRTRYFLFRKIMIKRVTVGSRW
jgi:hypothetical protein